MIQIQIILAHTPVRVKIWQRFIFQIALLAFVGVATESDACVGASSDEVMTLRCKLEFVAGKVITKRELQALNSKLRRNGYLPFGGSVEPTYVDSSVTFTPLLNYEPNINGGNPAKNLKVGGLEFLSDPAHFRVSGLTSGLKMQMNGRFATTEGQVIDIKAKYALQQAIEFSQLMIRDKSISLCFSTQISPWNLSRICREHLHNKRDLTSSTFSNTSLGQYVYSNSDNKTFRNGVEFVQEIGGYNYNTVRLTHQSVDFNGNGYKAFATLKRSRTSPGVQEQKFGISGNLDFFVFHEFSLENTQTLHQPLLGVERKDISWTISTEIQLSRDILFMLGCTQLNSTIDYFDDLYPFASFQLSF